MKQPSATPKNHNPVELTILLTSFIAATYAFGVYLFSTLLPDMRGPLALSYTHIGWITGSAQVGFLAGSFFSARLVQALGDVRLILGSVFVCCVCLGLMPYASSAVHIAVLMVMTGCTAATVWVPMISVVQSSISPQHQGKALGLISSGTAYGLFLSGLTNPTLLQQGGWKLVWWFSAALTFALFVWGIARLGERKPSVRAPNSNPAHPTNEVARNALIGNPVAVIVILLMFVNGLACMPTMNYLVAFLREELGYSVETAGGVWSTIGFVGMFGGFAMGALADKISAIRSLQLTYLILGGSTLLILHHASVWEVFLGAALFGLAFNSIFGLIPAFVSQAFDAHRATAVFALCNVALGVGSMLGNLLGGLLREHQQSFVPVYALSLVLGLVLLGLSLQLQREHRKQLNPIARNAPRQG